MLSPSSLLSPWQRQNMRFSAPALDFLDDLRRLCVPLAERGVGRDELPAVQDAIGILPAHDGSDVIQVVAVDKIAPVRANEIRHLHPRNLYRFCAHETACTEFPSRVTASCAAQIRRQFKSLARKPLAGAELASGPVRVIPHPASRPPASLFGTELSGGTPHSRGDA